jgi:hypothetical protein
MRITACPKCGSKNIFQGTMGDGVLTGYTTKDVCRNCGYQGSPIIFDSEREYEFFLTEFEGVVDKGKTELKLKNSVEDQGDDIINIPNNDKEVVKLLEEYDKEKCIKSVWSKKKSWWSEIIVSIIFSSCFYYIAIRPTTLNMNIGISTIYAALFIISSFVIFLLFIIFIEYILRIILGVFTKK